jgi:hypothetical protein
MLSIVLSLNETWRSYQLYITPFHLPFVNKKKGNIKNDELIFIHYIYMVCKAAYRQWVDFCEQDFDMQVTTISRCVHCHFCIFRINNLLLEVVVESHCKATFPNSSHHFHFSSLQSKTCVHCTINFIVYKNNSLIEYWWNIGNVMLLNNQSINKLNMITVEINVQKNTKLYRQK